MRRAWLCLILASCHSEGSLEVWVEPGPGMTVNEVELYVGIHDPHIGESIRPMRGSLAETVWWKRDHNRTKDILPWDAEAIERGAVRYQLLPDDLDTVRGLVAVGYLTDNGARKMVGVATYLHDAEIGSGEIYRRYMTLGAFDELPRRNLQPARDGVPGIQVWGPPDDPAACVQIDNAPELNLAEYGSETASAMIVTHDDPDCDGYVVTEAPSKDECVPAEFNGVAPRPRESLSCLVPEQFAISSGTGTTMVPGCVAGGPACADGTGDTTCTASSWCAPTPLCGSTGTPPTCNDFVCEGQNTTSRIECLLRYDLSSSPPRWCSGTLAALSIPGVECDPTRVTMMRKPLSPAWLETLVYGSGDEMWLTVLPKTPSTCGFEIKASGPLQINATTNLVQDNYPAAIAFPLKKPVDGRGLGLPIRVRGEPTADCQQEFVGSCQVLSFPDPGLAACMAAPINDPALRVP